MRFVGGQRRGEKVWNGVEDVVERWVRMVRGWNWIKRRSSVCCGYWSLWRASSYRPLPTHSREKLAPRRPCERMRTTTPSRIIRVSTHYTCYNRREPPIQISSLEIFLLINDRKTRIFSISEETIFERKVSYRARSATRINFVRWIWISFREFESLQNSWNPFVEFLAMRAQITAYQRWNSVSFYIKISILGGGEKFFPVFFFFRIAEKGRFTRRDRERERDKEFENGGI